MRILGIDRDERFSPNSVERDRAIFFLVTKKLWDRGYEPVVCDEKDVKYFVTAPSAPAFDVIYSMARSEEALRLLSVAERTYHIPVINSARAIRENTRAWLTYRLDRTGIPQPPNVTMDTHKLIPLEFDDRKGSMQFPLWVKRGDACAQSAGDVSFAPDHDATILAIRALREKGVHEAVLVEHAEGDLVKFYGVEGSPFFYCLYPTEGGGFSKFGLEAHNGPVQHYVYDVARLKSFADHAARVSGFLVYGGDAIVRADGSFLFIDFNDWPSFSPCREQAAEAIVQRILSMNNER